MSEINMSTLCTLNIKQGEKAENLSFFQSPHGAQINILCSMQSIPKGAHVHSSTETAFVFKHQALTGAACARRNAAQFSSVFTLCVSVSR